MGFKQNLSKIYVKLSNFHKQALNYGKIMFTHNFSPHNSLLWNNRVIAINRKSIFKGDWFNKGLLFVHHVLDSSGHFLSFKDFYKKYNITSSKKKFEKICKAIPIPLLKRYRAVCSVLWLHSFFLL